MYLKISPVIELVGGSGPHEGNVMIRGQPVCDDYWSQENAMVVCRFDQEFCHHSFIQKWGVTKIKYSFSQDFMASIQ